MTRRWALAAALLAAPPAAAGQSPAASPGATVTVEGCVTRDDRPGSAVRALYVLTDRRPAPPPATTGSAEASTSSGATAAGNVVPRRRLYVLRAATESIELSRHVGRMVRATGATTARLTTAPLAGRSPEATPVPAATAPAGATGSADDTAHLPTLAVTTLTGIDGTCR